jgi:hypothetical protein
MQTALSNGLGEHLVIAFRAAHEYLAMSPMMNSQESALVRVPGMPVDGGAAAAVRA